MSGEPSEKIGLGISERSCGSIKAQGVDSHNVIPQCDVCLQYNDRNING